MANAATAAGDNGVAGTLPVVWVLAGTWYLGVATKSAR